MKKLILLLLLTTIILSSCSDIFGSKYDYSATITYPDDLHGYVSRKTYDSSGSIVSTNSGFRTSGGQYRWSWDDCSHNYLRLELEIKFYYSSGVEHGTGYGTFYLSPGNPHQQGYYY